jgi:hypothetical protein
VEALAPIILLPGLLMMGISFSLVVLVFSAYFRLKGIERALWAVVSQIQAARAEQHQQSLPDKKLVDESTVPVHRRVVNSMFGR